MRCNNIEAPLAKCNSRIYFSCIVFVALYQTTFCHVTSQAFLFLGFTCPSKCISIFFGEKMGNLIGVRFRLTFAAPTVDKTSPAIFVAAMGWVLLLMPLVVVLFVY